MSDQKIPQLDPLDFKSYGDMKTLLEMLETSHNALVTIVNALIVSEMTREKSRIITL